MSTHAAAPAGKRIQKLHATPWKARARTSRAVRKHLDAQDRITPHFTWAEFACQDSRRTPVPASLRANTIRLCWLLEKLRHQLGDVPLSIDSGYRTPERNKEVGGAPRLAPHARRRSGLLRRPGRQLDREGHCEGSSRRDRGRQPYLREGRRRQRDLGHLARRCPRLEGALRHLDRCEIGGP
jgi:hypothetical protein